MPLPRPASPRVLIADIRAFAGARSRHQWVAALAAVLMPIVIVFGFVKDATTNTAPGEQIVYVKSWTAQRTDAEILADQKRHEAERKAAAVERQRQYRKLAERLGMDED
jgi:hypothetical protein